MLNYVKSVAKNIRREIQATEIYLNKMEISKWKIACKKNRPYKTNTIPKRIFIIPSDPWALQGAKGDEAMMEGAIGRIRRISPDVELAVVTATEQATRLAREKGFTPFLAWKRRFSYQDIVEALESFKPDVTLVLGADVMDGYYSPVNSARAPGCRPVGSPGRAGVCARLQLQCKTRTRIEVDLSASP